MCVYSEDMRTPPLKLMSTTQHIPVENHLRGGEVKSISKETQPSGLIAQTHYMTERIKEDIFFMIYECILYNANPFSHC